MINFPNPYDNIGFTGTNTSGNFYVKACLSPENMQALEAMIRRVVAEELDKFFPQEEEQEQEEEEIVESPFLGRD